MCGITGFWAESIGTSRATDVVRAMCDSIAHRGPDAEGVWVRGAVALGHRRLAILDVSEAGAQPMSSPSGRYVMVYNGEVYNHLDLRAELDETWRGTSDTETMLAAFEKWGITASVKRFVGMFACAIWDTKEEELVLIRDRLGIKPLYWGKVGSALVFGSELKTFRAFPGFESKVDRGALAAYMRANCVPHPQTIYKGVHQMSPGTILRARRGITRVEVFWSARDVARNGLETPLHFGTNQAELAKELLHEELMEAVKLRLLSDVPLGAFLSGGVDSSLVVALMQAQSENPVRTFSIGFEDKAYDEADHARAVAKHLGTNHTELVVRPEDALEVVPRLSQIWDEPFADSSQIPTFLVSQLARQHVTVSLSGDGGDELFGGYNRHILGPKAWGLMSRLPSHLRGSASDLIGMLRAEQTDRLFGALDGRIPGAGKMRLPTDKLQKLGRILGAKSFQELYARLVTHWDSGVVLGAPDVAAPWAEIGSNAETMMLLDMETYLPDDILTKVDRASMAVSLEARVPLLDHRVVEFAWRLPLDMKIRPKADPAGKWLLRQVLYNYVPSELIDRPKMGFGVPIDAWLRGPLREWAEDLLHPDRLKQEGYFDPAPIRQKWDEHQSRAHNWQHHLWDVLMFQAWNSQT